MSTALGKLLSFLLCTWELRGFQVQVCISEWRPRAFTVKRASVGGGAWGGAVKWQITVTIDLYIHRILTSSNTWAHSPGALPRRHTWTGAHYSEHDFGVSTLLSRVSHFRLLSPSLINQSYHIPLRLRQEPELSTLTAQDRKVTG